MDLCRDAVETAELRQWNQREYELLSAARGIAGGVKAGRQAIGNSEMARAEN